MVASTQFLLKKFGLLAALLALSACGTIPGAGPFNGETQSAAEVTISIEKNATGEQEELQFVLINTTKLLMDNLDQFSYSEPVLWPELVRTEPLRVNVGDSLNITIYESRSGGLFIPKEAGVRPGNFISLPTQIVDATGTLTVPYVGTFNVVGLTPTEISNYITDKLKNRAIEPQAIVSYGDREGSEVSIIGDVNEAARFSLNFAGETILDGIARAGGPRYAGHDTKVTLQRSNKEMSIQLDKLIQDPSKNIYLQANDIVYLYKEANTYSIFGAANGNGRYEHGRRKLLLSEALGKSGGLNNLQADASEIFVFRYLDRETIRNFMLLENPDSSQAIEFDEKVPTVFRFNLREPTGFFYTQNFSVEDNDVIYIPDADTVDLNKFISILSPSTSTSVNVKSLNN